MPSDVNCTASYLSIPRSFGSDPPESWHRVQQVACGALSHCRYGHKGSSSPQYTPTSFGPKAFTKVDVVSSAAGSLNCWI